MSDNSDIYRTHAPDKSAASSEFRRRGAMTGKVKSKLAAQIRGPKRIVVPEATILPTHGKVAATQALLMQSPRRSDTAVNQPN
jgi:hypothetical protein